MRTRVFVVVSVIALRHTPAKAQQSASEDAPIHRASLGVMAGLLRHRVEPEYPAEARARKLQGDVVLDVIVDTKGNVVTAEPKDGDPLLRDAAVKAVRQWRYKPYLLN